MKNLIEKYESLGFVLTLKNEPMIIGCCMKKASKARFPKPLFNYRFRSVESMIEFCNQWIEKVEKNIKAENERKALKKEAQKNMNHIFEVGSIFYNSWGYEQTNISFYQVVEVKSKSIMIQKIASSFVKGSEGFMCANVKPVKNAFIGEPILKKVIVSVGYNGNIGYHIKSQYGGFYEYKNQESGVYSSWYA
jgi:hypothetical protein